PLDHGVDPHQVAATELNGNTRDGNVSFGTRPDGSDVYIRDYTLRGEVHDEKAFYTMAGIAGHAGLFSTTSDMAVLTQLMLNDGIYAGRQYFAQDVIEEFTTPYAADPSDADFSTIGLGWRVHSKRAAAYYYFNWGPSRSTFGHQGWTGTLTVIDPLHDMTITVLTNMRHSPVIDPPAQRVCRRAVRGLGPRTDHRPHLPGPGYQHRAARHARRPVGRSGRVHRGRRCGRPDRTPAAPRRRPCPHAPGSGPIPACRGS